MTNIDEYAEPLERAIETMRTQMAEPENVSKETWHNFTAESLFNSIYHNCDKLASAVYVNDRREAFKQAANIANHAWMIADNIPEREDI